LEEAAEWARHFGKLEQDMDDLLATLLGITRQELDKWIGTGRYVTGREFAKAGLAELVETTSTKSVKQFLSSNGAAGRRKQAKAGRKLAP
jgi:hypothetical protein